MKRLPKIKFYTNFAIFKLFGQSAQSLFIALGGDANLKLAPEVAGDKNFLRTNKFIIRLKYFIAI